MVSGRAWSRTMITTLKGRLGAACSEGASETVSGKLRTRETPSLDATRPDPSSAACGKGLSYLIYHCEVNGLLWRTLASVSGMDTFSIGGELEVHRLGFGAMRITGKGIWGPPDDPDEAKRLLRRVVESGVDLIDTADSYGPEVSENLIAEALHPYPDGLVIATKGGLRRTGPGQWPRDARPERLKQACEGSLRRLKLDRIDLYQLHSPDPQVPYADSVGALKELQDEGKIRHVGISNVSVDELHEARGIVEVVTVQNRFSLEDRASEDVLDVCEEAGIGFIPWFPLATGRLADPGGPLERIDRKSV